MEKILLNGMHHGEALIDEEDNDLVMKYKWYSKKQNGNNFYACTFATHDDRNSKFLMMHRLVLGLLGESNNHIIIDHINGNGLDNRKINLRLVTIRENNINRKKDSHHRGKPCHSKYKGVTWSKSKGMWESHIGYNNKLLYLGKYENELDAAFSYNKASEIINGEYSKPNLLPECYSPSESFNKYFDNRWSNIGKGSSGENNGQSKLTVDNVIDIYRTGKLKLLTIEEIAQNFSISASNVRHILAGKRWYSVTKDIII